MKMFYFCVAFFQDILLHLKQMKLEKLPTLKRSLLFIPCGNSLIDKA